MCYLVAKKKFFPLWLETIVLVKGIKKAGSNFRAAIGEEKKICSWSPNFELGLKCLTFVASANQMEVMETLRILSKGMYFLILVLLVSFWSKQNFRVADWSHEHQNNMVCHRLVNWRRPMPRLQTFHFFTKKKNSKVQKLTSIAEPPKSKMCQTTAGESDKKLQSDRHHSLVLCFREVCNPNKYCPVVAGFICLVCGWYAQEQFSGRDRDWTYRGSSFSRASPASSIPSHTRESTSVCSARNSWQTTNFSQIQTSVWNCIFAVGLLDFDPICSDRCLAPGALPPPHRCFFVAQSKRQVVFIHKFTYFLHSGFSFSNLIWQLQRHREEGMKLTTEPRTLTRSS